MELKNKVVFLTGASRGIGAAAAQTFVDAGAKVALASRGVEPIEALAAELGEDNALAVPCDVSRYAQVEAAVAVCEAKFGPVDILVGNAGVVEPISHMAESDPTEWAKVIETNLNGVYYGMRAILPGMIERGGGTILTVSSGAAHNPVEAWSHYCASKARAAMLTRSLHKEYGDKGIRAMGLSPGTVATQMQKEIKASGINPVSQLEWSDHVPPEWPAKALVWMCTDAARAHVGEELSLREPELRAALGLQT